MTDSRALGKTKAVLRRGISPPVGWWLIMVVLSALPVRGREDGTLPEITPSDLGCSVTRFTVEDGLPERNVMCLAQTADGYLWCGTFSGLVRFDGNRFKVFDPVHTPELDEVQIQELRCDSQGRLWIGGSTGELVVYENGVFRRISDADGLPLHQAGKLGEDPHGDFWVKGRSNGKFYRYRGNRFKEVDSGVPGSDIDRFIANPAGLEWAVREKGRTMIHFTARGPESQPMTAPDGQSETTLGRFFHLQDGALAVTSSHGVYALQGFGWTLRAKFNRTIAGQALDGVEDWDGNFWVSFSGVGIVVCQPAGRTALVSLPDKAELPYFPALMLDAEGNVWAAGDGGLYRIRHDTFHPRPGLAETRDQHACGVVEDSSGAIWLLYPKGLARLKAGRWEYLPNPDADSDLWTGAFARDGGIYLAYANYKTPEQCLVKLSANGERRKLGSVKGYPRVILERRNGEIWMATDTGVWRLHKGEFERVTITGETGDYQVYAMVEDRDGRMIVGAFRRGMYRQEKDGAWRRLTTTNDLGSTLIVSLYLDEENTLWAATDRGLARWKDQHWYAYSDAGGALPGWVRNVVSDKHGGLWLTSQFGVTRVERSALNALADGKDVALDSSRYDHSDGLPSTTCEVNQQTVLRSSDGRIWVATAKGAAVADPADWVRRRDRRSAPPVKIESMLVDDKSVLGPGKPNGESDSARIVVPPGADRLEFRYTAIDLTANGRSRFRYRLAGLDKEWRDAEDQRSVVYHYLSPGDYRFQVTAANNYGLWNASGDSVSFTIRPHWWQTVWFRLGLGALFLGSIGLIRQFQLNQLRRKHARQEEFARRLIEIQEAERKRLAGELHDDLGQDLLVIKSRLDTSRQDSGHSEQGGLIGELSGSVTNLIRKVREISHALRPLQLERLGLSSCARSMVEEVSEATGIHIETDIDDLRGQLSATAEIGLYRILQEALNNVVKHSDASEVRVALKRTSDHVILSVKDDGRGFSLKRQEEPGDAMGHGLAGMAERCRLMGGHFQVSSSPGNGTSIRVEVPMGEGTAIAASQ